MERKYLRRCRRTEAAQPRHDDVGVESAAESRRRRIRAHVERGRPADLSFHSFDERGVPTRVIVLRVGGHTMVTSKGKTNVAVHMQTRKPPCAGTLGHRKTRANFDKKKSHAEIAPPKQKTSEWIRTHADLGVRVHRLLADAGRAVAAGRVHVWRRGGGELGRRRCHGERLRVSVLAAPERCVYAEAV